jgi:hypothetical protein
LGFRYGRKFWYRIEPPSAWLGALNNGLLLTQRYRLTVLLSRPHAPQPNLLFQNNAAFDHQGHRDQSS